MRVAILHDYLNQFGGGERVLQALIELFPKADLFTLLYDEKKTFGLFRNNIKKTSFLDVNFVRNRHRAFIPFMPFAANTLRSREKYDLIVSSTAGYGKGINIEGRYHISYCHSPLRYAWEIDYLKNLAFAPWQIKETILRPIAKALRGWDRESSKRVNIFLANSHYIADKVRNYYGREAEVVYPPVATSFFREKDIKPQKFFLMAGRLLYYKGFDLGIRAFNRLRLPLVIVGNGPELKKLQSLVENPEITFLKNVSDESLRRLYHEAQALIFPQIEDFGLVAAEAQMCGLPVIAFKGGGASEIVIASKTGLFFNEQNPEAIIRAVQEFNSYSFNREGIAGSALRFEKETFKANFMSVLKRSGFRSILV